MQTFTQVLIIGIIAVIFSAILKKNNRDLALLLSLAACVLIALLLLSLAEPILEFLGKLRSLSGLEQGTMTPLLKTLGVGILTQICATICADAGENALAGLIEVCGSLLALYVSLPLLEAVIDMVETMSGG